MEKNAEETTAQDLLLHAIELSEELGILHKKYQKLILELSQYLEAARGKK